MIITKLVAGLGNQLFQYAVGRQLAELNGAELGLDVSAYKTPSSAFATDITVTKNSPRTFQLERFQIKARIASEKEVVPFKKYRRRSGRMWFLYNRLVADRKKYFLERQFHFDPEVLAVKDPAFLEGWWVTEKYFTNIREKILEEITLKEPLSREADVVRKKIEEASAPQGAAAVALHIRRGDYANDPATREYHGLCSIEYYQKAVEKIAESVPNPTFFIFSDDIDWAKANLSLPYPTHFASDGNNKIKDYEELVLMSLCKHQIIANSTFSWWGAWLNRNPDKIVIAPEKWFNKVKSSMRTDHVIPETWIRLWLADLNQRPEQFK